MSDIISTLLWLLSVVGQPAYLQTADGGFCEGSVTRMGVATFHDCRAAQTASCVWVAEPGQDDPEECEPVGYAERVDWRLTDVDGWRDDWELHFSSEEPEGWN